MKNDVVKKTTYHKLVAKVDNIDTTNFALKTKYNTDKTQLENKIPDTNGLVKKTGYNTKVADIEIKLNNHNLIIIIMINILILQSLINYLLMF